AASYGANYAYTRTGALKSVSFTGLNQAASVTYALDNAARPIAVTSTTGTSGFTVAADLVYDAADRITSARYGNLHRTYWMYDPLSERLDRIEYRNASNNIHTAVAYAYDAGSNIVREDRYKLNVSGIWRQ